MFILRKKSFSILRVIFDNFASIKLIRSGNFYDISIFYFSKIIIHQIQDKYEVIDLC